MYTRAMLADGQVYKDRELFSDHGSALPAVMSASVCTYFVWQLAVAATCRSILRQHSKILTELFTFAFDIPWKLPRKLRS